MKNNPIPEEFSTYGAFTEIDQHNELLIQDIIKEVSADANAAQGSVAQKIRDFYNAGMDTVAIKHVLSWNADCGHFFAVFDCYVRKRVYCPILPAFQPRRGIFDASAAENLYGKQIYRDEGKGRLERAKTGIK
jgi:Predicted metalloendopeptidase